MFFSRRRGDDDRSFFVFVAVLEKKLNVFSNIEHDIDVEREVPVYTVIETRIIWPTTQIRRYSVVPLSFAPCAWRIASNLSFYIREDARVIIASL